MLNLLYYVILSKIKFLEKKDQKLGYIFNSFFFPAKNCFLPNYKNDAIKILITFTTNLITYNMVLGNCRSWLNKTLMDTYNCWKTHQHDWLAEIQLWDHDSFLNMLHGICCEIINKTETLNEKKEKKQKPSFSSKSKKEKKEKKKFRNERSPSAIDEIIVT